MSDPDASAPRPQRILIAEDDPVSASFLGEAMQRLGFEVHACAQGHRALRLAQGKRFDLLLLDCHLPGMGARQILEALQADAGAASRHAPVLATSAEISPAMQRDLQALGCRAVLRKPLRLDDLEQAVRRFSAGTPVHLVDDAAGLQASGSPDNLRALRTLFAEELATLADEWPALRGDATKLRERLHRLRSSCGFCGALALQEACAALERSLDADTGVHRRAWAHFESRLDDTLRQLRKASDRNTH